MEVTRSASVSWSGGIRDGKGTITTQSGALNACPYGFGSRFDSAHGSNPEELIAAAHACCFSMALTLLLGKCGKTPTSIEIQAAVRLAEVAGGYAITHSRLSLQARVPGLDETEFHLIATEAKAGCPVSKLMKAEIALEAKLLG